MKQLAILPAMMLVLSPVHAQMHHGDMKSMDMKAKEKGASATVHKAHGTVKSLNAGEGTVSIAHDAIQTLNWPAMTMTFKLRDKAMADQLKRGEKVEFSFVQSGKDYVLTEIK